MRARPLQLRHARRRSGVPARPASACLRADLPTRDGRAGDDYRRRLAAHPVATELGMLSPVHRPGGRRSWRLARDRGCALRPDRLFPGQRDARDAFARRCAVGRCAPTAHRHRRLAPSALRAQLYVRDGRRMVGDTVLSEHDLLAGRMPGDTVAVGSYNMRHPRGGTDLALLPDYHPLPAVFKQGYLSLPVPDYGLPYRVLLPRAESARTCSSRSAARRATWPSAGTQRAHPDGPWRGGRRRGGSGGARSERGAGGRRATAAGRAARRAAAPST